MTNYYRLLAIYPTPGPQATMDRRMENLVNYAKKVEGQLFEMASSRVCITPF